MGQCNQSWQEYIVDEFRGSINWSQAFKPSQWGLVAGEANLFLWPVDEAIYRVAVWMRLSCKFGRLHMW